MYTLLLRLFGGSRGYRGESNARVMGEVMGEIFVQSRVLGGFAIP